MTTTTADKGELLPCPFCGEQPTQDDVGSYFVQCPECGVEGPYGSPDAEESAAIAAWNRRATNEGQDTLTDSEILTDAHRYCCKYVHADDAPYRFTERGIIEFVRLRVERALNQRLAVKEGEARVGVNGGVEGEKLKVVITTDMAGRCVAVTRQNPEGQIKEVIWELSTHPVSDGQQAKDAARYRWLREQQIDKAEVVIVTETGFRVSTWKDDLDKQIDAALSTTKQEEVLPWSKEDHEAAVRRMYLQEDQP